VTCHHIAAVILAAGESARLGQPKQLLQFHGKTLLRRVVDAASDAACRPILVVVASSQAGGSEPFAADINSELNKTGAKVVANPNWKHGIGTSIRAGVEHLIQIAPEVDGTVLLACDQPFVDSGVISRLIALRRATGKPIVASSYGGSLGVPALFDRAYLKELVRLNERTGAKQIILSNRDRVAELPFPEGNSDIDTAEDWQRLSRS